jgi:hypothetical protein
LSFGDDEPRIKREEGIVGKKKSEKAKARNLPAKALSAKQATRVKGGDGEKPVKYMEIKLKEDYISNVPPGGKG